MLNPELDKILFWLSVTLILLVCIPMALAPERASDLVTSVYNWIAGELGLFYQWATIGSAILLAWLAFSRYGARRLGGPDSQPEYSTVSWVAMLFCAGIGAGLLYWSTIEWASYLATPPFDLEVGSAAAREWAATYGIFHWGISAWCLYCLPTIAIAYPYYQQKVPYLRLSTALVGLAGNDVGDRPLGRVVDFIFIVALVGGTGTSLGLATPMIAACVSALVSIPENIALDVTVVFICVALFAFSVYLGLDKGIKRLSIWNLYIALGFTAFVLAAGPTMYQLKLGTNSIGLMVQEFVRLNTWTDPILQSGFVEDWSIFYWAWWLAYGPFIGLFVTRISKGRTLRQLILGMIGYGTLGCALFYITVGNTAMWLDANDIVAVQQLVREGRADTAIAEIMSALPLHPLPLLVFVVMAFIFVATTYDSASYAIAASATRRLPPGAHPARWHRLFWAFALAILPITLMIVGGVGGLKAIQSAVLVVSLPLLLIGVGIVWSLLKSLRDS